ncbi:pentatricopeptide repeat-containing protein [Striga asiatica]|uniref:Pentatricopeptide repeat-containing protein n=1 Tax=Striga asiatica TaxID=4170 RepID=A0A5A7QZR2_STRAF|nr:pentatricopeptide repeat-containing protein [Striga asiatica]
MAIKLNAKLQYSGPVHDRDLFKPNVPNRKPARKLPATVAFHTLHKTNSTIGNKLFESGAEYGPFRKAVVQELVDRLHLCAEKGLLTEAGAVHGYVLKSNFDDYGLLVLLNHVMHAYSKCSDFKSAKLVFDILPRKNAFSWSVIILGFNQQESFRDGLIYFRKMVDDGIPPNGVAYSAVLQSCIGMDSVDFGGMVHAHILVRGFGSHVVVSTGLLNMYAKQGKVDEVYKVFNSMAEHNVVTWNTMISGLSANGLHLEAFDHFLKMKESGLVPDIYTYIGVLKAVGMLGDVDKGKQVHECILELGMMDNIVVGTSLIDMYSKGGHIDEARSAFMYVADSRANGPWNAMIGGYNLCNYSEQALLLFVEMCRKNIKSDLYTYCSVFDAVAKLKCLRLVQEVHGVFLKSGCVSMDPSVENAILDAYSKCGSLEHVNKIFNNMTHRDIVSWTTLVSGYSQYSKWEDALVIFSRMRKEEFTPNNFTLASVLTACANLGYLEYGRQIHGLVCKLGFETVNYIESSLIDMYAKGGGLKESEKIFARISRPDAVSMTAIISAYAYHGFAAHALWHFKKMEQMNIKPSAVTLLCVLSACSHAGLVEEGLHYFWSMDKDYGLVPKMEHYACVVDLLGRVGRIHEAYDFIMRMDLEPDEMVWQALLAACRIHGNAEIGEIAAEKILSLCSDYSSTYVLLSNTYSERGDFTEGSRLRTEMREKGVRKEPGCSWISVKGRVHRFYAADKDHPSKQDIYGKLDELRQAVKDFGYVPELKFALLIEG